MGWRANNWQTSPPPLVLILRRILFLVTHFCVRVPGGQMQTMIRWLAAISVTIGAFVIGLYGAGSLVLPLWVKSGADRWVIAAGFGVALAALAALWGVNFAQARLKEVDASADSPHPAPRRMVAKASGRAKMYQAGRDQNFNGK